MKSLVCRLAMVGLCMLSVNDAAASQDVLSGVIVNHTQTPYAHQFYRAFSAAMSGDEDRPAVAFSSLCIEEKAHSRSGSLVSVENESGVLAQMTLYAGSPAQAEKMGAAVAALVQQKLTEQMLDNALLSDPDLAKGELK